MKHTDYMGVDMTPLNQEQIQEIQKEMVKDGVPVRFMYGGESRNILSGQGSGKHINIIHQRVYWNFTKETARKIADWTGTRPEFSE
jgi:hypothetical protein